jgi:uncharacterized protein (TIGR02597 family)
MPSRAVAIIPRVLFRLSDRIRTPKIISCFLLLVANAVLLPPVFAQSATSEPVGFTTTSLLANSDTVISIPFTRVPEFTGAVQSVSGNVITVAGTPGWTPNKFVYAAGLQPKSYFVLIGGGPTANPPTAPKLSIKTAARKAAPISDIQDQSDEKESLPTDIRGPLDRQGHSYLVTANGTETLTVNPGSDNLAGIRAGTRVIVIPYWTLATIFPPSDASISFTPTTSTSSYKTQILVPNNAGSGTSLPVNTYFFSNNVNGLPNNIGWRVVGSNTTDRGDDPLLPNGYLIVRNLNGSPTLPLKGIGAVLTKKFATPLRSLATQAQDNAVSMIRPIGVTLNQTGLSPNDGSFVATPGEIGGEKFAVKDQLLLFDNSVAAINKQPGAVYYYSAAWGETGSWRLVGDPLAGDHGNDLIPAGSAMLLRKAKTASDTTVFWINAPTY